MIYLSSDLHLLHDRDFLYQPRGYDNVYSMSEDIIKKINEVVGVDDELYLLGDLMLNDNEAGRKLLAQIKCPNIHIIAGNHCTNERIKIYETLWNVVDIKFADRLKYGKWNFMLSHYPMMTGNTDDDKKKTSQRMYCLCGHYHSKDKFVDMKNGIPAYHVEWDAHGKPIAIEDIIADIKEFYREG